MVDQKCSTEMVSERRGVVEEKPLYTERVKIVEITLDGVLKTPPKAKWPIGIQTSEAEMGMKRKEPKDEFGIIIGC